MQKIKKVCAAYENETCVLKLQRDVIWVVGPDAGKYLQGQLTQDVLAMAEGESAWSFLLNPDGKVNAWLRITHIGEQKYLLDMDSDSGEVVLARLLRFKLRTDCELILEKWEGITIIGKDASSFAGKPSSEQIAAQTLWPQISSVDIIGGDTKALFERFPEPKQSYDFLRIVNCIPKMGAELHEKVIPAETGLVEMSVSFSKGCYTGQELVARIDSRGNKVPKNLVLVACQEGMAIGDEVEVDGFSVGQL
ncbi:MAG: YgfZ/GcvT domain-containing protein, partial [Acidimicrobiales bacterium]